MARQTKKYLAAVAQSKVLALRNPSNIANDKLYERLDEKGYWWNGQQWTNEPRRRQVGEEYNYSVASADLLQLRLILHQDRAAYGLECIQRLAATLGWSSVEVSKPYPSRDNADRLRYYLSFLIPADVVVSTGSTRRVYINQEGELEYEGEAGGGL